jgi:TRAP-type uncharacterized transport system substrate-binding protein
MTESSTVKREGRLASTLKTAGIVVIAVALLVSVVIIRPSQPKTIVLLTGPEGSSYHEIGKLYARELRGRGLATEVVVTDGGMDNLQRLAGGAEDAVAFAPSNLEHAIQPPVDAEHLVSLGSVAHEPLWFFYRSELEIRDLKDIALLRVATGDEGTVLAWIVRRLLEVNGIQRPVGPVPEAEQTPEAVVEALRAGSLDGVFAMGAPRSPAIQEMLHADGITLLSFERADAYVALTPGLTKLEAPEGVFDLARDVPPVDAELISATTNLVSRDSLHPALVPLLLSAAASFHDEQSIFATRETFPSREGVSLPLDRAAVRYFDQGETGLAKRVPYSLARHLNHLGFVVLPLVGLAVVVVKFLPIVLRVWTNLRLTGLFKKLEAVEKAHAAGTDRAELLTQLAEIDRASSGIFVPRSKLAEYIDFRQFLHDMRDRIAGGSAG